VGDQLAALRRKAHDLGCLAVEKRAAGDVEMAVHHEGDAMLAWAQVATLELADGNAFGAPMDGQVAA
jgi:hypothetical protein